MAWYRCGGDPSVLTALQHIVARDTDELSTEHITNVGRYTFYGWSGLKTVNLPQAVSLGYGAFYQCSDITSVSIPNATTIGSYAFYNCGNMTSISMSNVTTIDSDAFYNCGKLSQAIDLPYLTTISSEVFRRCYKITSGNFPIATAVGSSAFQDDGELTILDFGAVTSIGGQAFWSASKLATVIIRTDQVATLGSVNAFSGTPFNNTSSGGILYVPQSLISSYQSANNWSTILGYDNNQILAIEGSPYENI